MLELLLSGLSSYILVWIIEQILHKQYTESVGLKITPPCLTQQPVNTLFPPPPAHMGWWIAAPWIEKTPSRSRDSQSAEMVGKGDLSPRFIIHSRWHQQYLVRRECQVTCLPTVHRITARLQQLSDVTQCWHHVHTPQIGFYAKNGDCWNLSLWEKWTCSNSASLTKDAQCCIAGVAGEIKGNPFPIEQGFRFGVREVVRGGEWEGLSLRFQ